MICDLSIVVWHGKRMTMNFGSPYDRVWVGNNQILLFCPFLFTVDFKALCPLPPLFAVYMRIFRYMYPLHESQKLRNASHQAKYHQNITKGGDRFYSYSCLDSHDRLWLITEASSSPKLLLGKIPDRNNNSGKNPWEN